VVSGHPRTSNRAAWKEFERASCGREHTNQSSPFGTGLQPDGAAGLRVNLVEVPAPVPQTTHAVGPLIAPEVIAQVTLPRSSDRIGAESVIALRTVQARCLSAIT
jgi:hypothetical protein